MYSEVNAVLRFSWKCFTQVATSRTLGEEVFFFYRASHYHNTWPTCTFTTKIRHLTKERMQSLSMLNVLSNKYYHKMYFLLIWKNTKIYIILFLSLFFFLAYRNYIKINNLFNRPCQYWYKLVIVWWCYTPAFTYKHKRIFTDVYKFINKIVDSIIHYFTYYQFI